MDVGDLEPVLAGGPWVVALVVGIPVVGKIVLTAIALRGAEPKDRPGIIRAVAELFRWRKP